MAKARSLYAEWIARKVCCVCSGQAYHEDVGEWLSIPHHVKTRGAGGKEEGNLVPLCQSCHNRIHAMGAARFQDMCGVSVYLIARKLGNEWLPIKGKAECDG